jgi:tRNA(Ile2) C34 agmatinyltransferase TiaS
VGKVRVSDFDPIFLDDHAAELKLVREMRTRTCKQCGSVEETTWAGPDFFCSECRGKYRNV